MSKINKNEKNIENDDWTTPYWVWQLITKYIPKDKIIWEPFYNDGKSGEYLTDLGYNVIHKDIDFFDNNLGDWIVSNPPFSKKKYILTQLLKLNKPFMMLLPLDTIDRMYFSKLFKDKMDDITLFFLPKRIDFIGNGNVYRISTCFIGYKVNDKSFIYL